MVSVAAWLMSQSLAVLLSQGFSSRRWRLNDAKWRRALTKSRRFSFWGGDTGRCPKIDPLYLTQIIANSEPASKTSWDARYVEAWLQLYFLSIYSYIHSSDINYRLLLQTSRANGVPELVYKLLGILSGVRSGYMVKEGCVCLLSCYGNPCSFMGLNMVLKNRLK